MRKATLRTSHGMPEAMSNLCGYRRSIVEIEDVVEDSKNGIELVNGLNSLKLYRKFTLDRETDTKVRLKAVDCFGNVSYFEALKD